MSGKHLKNEVLTKSIGLSNNQKKEIDNLFKMTCEEIYKEFPINYNSSDKPTDYELDTIDRCLDEAIGMFTADINRYKYEQEFDDIDNYISENSSVDEDNRKYSDIENFLNKYSSGNNEK